MTTVEPETQDDKAPISNVETEYLEINSKGAWGVLYQHIRSECCSYNYTYDECKKPQNRTLNRYRDVSPYDHTRIVLKKGTCDYINANLIKVERAHRKYILTQGPLANTSGHFWLMVWEQNSIAILMLNKVIEKNQIKCHQYWPLENSKNVVLTFLDVGLKVEFISKIETSDYTTRTLRLTDLETDESREILHFHYTTWPDFGVPQNPTAFLRFLVEVRKSGALDESEGPAIVHCSAGIGRSGTFCLVDSCLVMIEENGLNSVNVREVLLEMRRSRMGLIQTPDQLRFSYAAIIEGSKRLPDVTDDLNDVTNHYDTVSSVCNSSIEEDDEPPPLPPPRGDSLTRSMMSDLTPSPSSETVEYVNGPPDKPLPREPPNRIDPNASPSVNNSVGVSNHVNEPNTTSVIGENSNDGENSFQNNSPPSSRPPSPPSSRPPSPPLSPDSRRDLRQRHMEKKKDRLAAQVREMKRRQQQSEDWQKLKRSKSDASEQSETVQEEEKSDS